MEQQVRVVLSAVVADYKSKMGEAARVTAEVGKSGQAAQSKLTGMGESMSQVGGTMTRSLTLPLAALGGLAVNAANDFEQSFGRMQGLAGVTADEVDGLKQSVMDLAGETGRGPQELADALYFASSAGFSAADAMDIVDKSAHAAAAGLGTTQDVVQAVTSVMGAYGKENISASQATDTLVAAARDAKIEASELAPQLGRLLPSAKLLGVGFGDLAGAMAFLSTISGDASLSATQLDGVLRKLQNPTEQGRKALAAMGTSVEELHAAIASGGLPAALDLIKAKFGGNSQALGELFDDSQALAGAQLILTDTTGNFTKAMEDANNATGAGADAFAKTEGPARDMQRSFADLQVALIKVGDVLAPIVATIAGGVAGLADSFSSLPGPVQEFLVTFGAIVAIAGPTTKVLGMITESLGLMHDKFLASRAAGEGFGQSLRSSMAGSIGVTVGAVTGLAMAFQLVQKMISDAKAAGEAFGNEVRAGFDPATTSADELAAKIDLLKQGVSDLRGAQKPGWQVWNHDSNLELQAGANSLVDFGNELIALQGRAAMYQVALGMTADEAIRFAATHTSFTNTSGKVVSAYNVEAAAATALGDAYKKQADNAKATMGPLFGMADALSQNASAHRAVSAAQRGAEAAGRDYAKAEQEVSDALAITADRAKAAEDGVRGLQDATRASLDPLFAMVDALEQNRKAKADALTSDDKAGAGLAVGRSAMAVEQAAMGLAGAIKTGKVSTDSANASLQSWVRQGLLSAQQAADIAARFGEAAASAFQLEGASVDAAVATSQHAADMKAADDQAVKLDAAYQHLADAQQSMADAQVRVAEAQQQQAGTALAVTIAQYELAGALANGTVKLDDARGMLQSWADQGLISQGQASSLAGEIQRLADKAKAVPLDHTTTFNADTQPFMLRVDEMSRYISDFLGPNGPFKSVAGLVPLGGLLNMLVPQQHAAGGIFDRPHLGLVAEAGPEAILPLADRSRSLQILAGTGLLNAQPAAGGGVNVTNVVQIGISPGAYPEGRVQREVVGALMEFGRSNGWSFLERELASVRR